MIEAKWLNRKVGIEDLGAFHAKLDQKALWARGLFISFHGSTAVGLDGFGRGRRLVGMDGRDIHEALRRGIAIDRLISLKVRHAAETFDEYAINLCASLPPTPDARIGQIFVHGPFDGLRAFIDRERNNSAHLD